MTWSGAQSYCRASFTDLVTVRNDSENFMVQNLVPSGQWAWIGLFRDPFFYWSDERHYSFSNWAAVNRIYTMNITCGAADLQQSGIWALLSCETRNPFVCYSSECFTINRILHIFIKRLLELTQKSGGAHLYYIYSFVFHYF